MTTYLNIGLARDGQPDLTTVDVADVLAANLIHTYELELQQSETEQTAVITTPLGVGQSVLWDIACRLGQDCIAVHDGHTGLLIGPKAEAWGPFDLSQFLFPKAQQEFTVEALSTGRVKVSWEDANYLYNFVATYDGDQLNKVIPTGGTSSKHIVRKSKHIVRKSKTLFGSTAYSYLPGATHGHIVLNATRFIRERKLITQAVKARDDRLAAQEAARIAENAKRVRNALATALKESREALGLHGMCSYQREALVIVQNMPDAFLHRVAALLGCD